VLTIRQALARAIYARTSILVLDDPFSALDRDTETQIIRNLFGPEGLCRLLNQTVFLTTSSGDFTKTDMEASENN
jgi:ATP-binding cassette subfamily C (CFTR/MRP) protein 1